MSKVSFHKTLYLALILSILLAMFANVAVAENENTQKPKTTIRKVCGMPSVIRHDHVHTSIAQRMGVATNKPNVD